MTVSPALQLSNSLHQPLPQFQHLHVPRSLDNSLQDQPHSVYSVSVANCSGNNLNSNFMSLLGCHLYLLYRKSFPASQATAARLVITWLAIFTQTAVSVNLPVLLLLIVSQFTKAALSFYIYTKLTECALCARRFSNCYKLLLFRKETR